AVAPSRQAVLALDGELLRLRDAANRPRPERRCADDRFREPARVRAGRTAAVGQDAATARLRPRARAAQHRPADQRRPARAGTPRAQVTAGAGEAVALVVGLARTGAELSGA